MGFAASIITTPVGRIIGLTGWSIIFALMLGAINGWYLNSVDAGVVDGERFDRVIPKSVSESAGERWALVTGTKQPDTTTADPGTAATTYAPSATLAHIVEEASNGACRIGRIRGGNTSARDIRVVATTYYTPLGTEVTSPDVTADGHASTPDTEDITISGCEFEEGSSVFDAGGLGGLIEIMFQAAGLAPPIALMFELGSFGTSFMTNIGGHPILAAVITGIILLMVATLLNTFIPFLLIAFNSVDGRRFVMYDEGLGNIAIVVRNFWGVVLIGSMLTIAWQVIKSMRGGGNPIAGSRSM